MPATVTSITPRRASGPRRAPEPPRRPFRDNPRLILAGIFVLVAVLIALLAIATGTSRFSPDFLSEFVLYGLSEVLSSANQIASDYYHEQQMVASDHANRLARTLSTVDLTNADVRPIRDLLAPDVTLQRVQMVEVYRAVPSAGSL